MTSNRREGQGGSPQGSHAERSPYQRHDRRNTNRQRGRVRAMSVLENAKSKSHPKDAPSRAWRHGSKVQAPYPGRSRAVRAGEKSAEAVVAKIASESWQEPRAEEQTRERQPFWTSARRRGGFRNLEGAATAAATLSGLGRTGAAGVRRREAKVGARVCAEPSERRWGEGAQ